MYKNIQDMLGCMERVSYFHIQQRQLLQQLNFLFFFPYFSVSPSEFFRISWYFWFLYETGGAVRIFMATAS